MTFATKRRALVGVAIGLLALAGTTFGGSTAFADSDPGNDHYSRAELPHLDAAEIDLMNSGQAITVSVDPATGQLMSVEETALIAPMSVTVTKTCTTGKACWKRWTTPYTDYAFSGTGTATGSWSNRGEFRSGSYTAKPCWRVGIGPTVCAQVFVPPNTTIVWGEKLTGVSVTLKANPI